MLGRRVKKEKQLLLHLHVGLQGVAGLVGDDKLAALGDIGAALDDLQYVLDVLRDVPGVTHLKPRSGGCDEKS